MMMMMMMTRSKMIQEKVQVKVHQLLVPVTFNSINGMTMSMATTATMRNFSSSKNGETKSVATTTETHTDTDIDIDINKKTNKKNEWEVACFNIGKLNAPYDHDSMKEFRLALGPINDIAKNTPGFIWMYDSNFGSTNGDDDDGNNGNNNENENENENRKTKLVPQLFLDDPTLMPQLSLWEDMDSLRHFVTRSGHASYLRRRREWFVSLPKPFSVCWYRRKGQKSSSKCSSSSNLSEPDLYEALEMLEALEMKGNEGGNVTDGDFGEHDDDDDGRCRYVFAFGKNYPDPPQC